MFDWDDPLWSAEYEHDAVYRVEIEYLDGSKDIGFLRYDKPVVNSGPINGYERLIIPSFVAVSPNFRIGAGKTIKVLAQISD